MLKTVKFSKHATNLFFHITTKCNLACRHCYINHQQHGLMTLPIDKIEKWLEVFVKRHQEANVIFLGGEPTLHPDLPQAIRAAKGMGYRSITVDTNGYLFFDFLSKITPEELDALSFSLDGATQETNDKLRGQGSYQQCIKGIEQAKAAGFTISLIYTVSQANVDELEKMPAMLTSMKVDHFFIQVIGLRGKSAHKNANTGQIGQDRWLTIIPDVAQKVADSGIKVTYPKVYLEPDETFECAGLVANNYFVFPNGRVYRCPLCEDFPIHSLVFDEDVLKQTPKLNESDFFNLSIAEGCVMNKLIQPDNISYDDHDRPVAQIACCMLKQELTGN